MINGVGWVGRWQTLVGNVSLSGGDPGQLDKRDRGLARGGGTHASVVTMGLGLDSIEGHIDFIASVARRLDLS